MHAENFMYSALLQNRNKINKQGPCLLKYISKVDTTFEVYFFMEKKRKKPCQVAK